MEAKEHTQWVGAIITNLQALETVLRYFLLRLHGEELEFPTPGDGEAKITYLTRFTSLGKLIKEYNAALKDAERKFEVDVGVVGIRDAFAHGRLLTTSVLPARLWKFGDNKRGKVPVAFCEELTVDWLKDTSYKIDRQRQNVVDCFTARGYQGLR
jgi:hypothetical protein